MLKIGLNPPSAVARHAVMYGAGLEMGELFAARDCWGRPAARFICCSVRVVRLLLDGTTWSVVRGEYCCVF